MKVFHCDYCPQLVFFENVQCLGCNHPLAFLPDLFDMTSLEQAGEDRWRPHAARAGQREYRLCENYSRENVCNWAVPADDPHPLCESCRLTRVIPDLGQPGQKAAWYKLEVAKRRLIYTLLSLDIRLPSKADDEEHGLAFEFASDPDPETPDAKPVLTGHAGGVITINVAEADDAERETRRMALHEPYRTLLGHFRHEIAHYLWDRLVPDSPQITRFREVFGDERVDYGAALERHYEQGPPADWQDRFVSAYASSHAWEDWAETTAHYLHMVDTLETAAASGLSLKPRRAGDPKLAPTSKPPSARSFDKLIADWFPLTYALNNLNRSLGLADGYPFVLSQPAAEKLRFVHQVFGLDD